MHGDNKLKCYITLSWKALTGTNSLAYWPHRKTVVNTTPDLVKLAPSECFVRAWQPDLTHKELPKVMFENLITVFIIFNNCTKSLA